MCLFLNPAILLVNLLHNNKNNDGVSYNDMEKYCDRIKYRFAVEKDLGIDFVSFGLYDENINYYIQQFPYVFCHINNKYYKGMEFTDYIYNKINSMVDNKYLQVLKETAVCN